MSTILARMVQPDAAACRHVVASMRVAGTVRIPQAKDRPLRSLPANPMDLPTVRLMLGRS